MLQGNGHVPLLNKKTKTVIKILPHKLYRWFQRSSQTEKCRLFEFPTVSDYYGYFRSYNKRKFVITVKLNANGNNEDSKIFYHF